MERQWSTNRSHGTFKEFEYVHPDGKKETINSLSRVREIESRSVDAYRQGQGAPIIFRQYSQDPNNMDQNVFGKSPDLRALGKKPRDGKPRISIKSISTPSDFGKD